MDRQEFRGKTRRMALGAIRLSESVRPSMASQAIMRQRLQSATSVDSNYRASGRARSPRDVNRLVGEADDILRMVVASIQTLRARNEMVREEEVPYDAEWMEDAPRSAIRDPL